VEAVLRQLQNFDPPGVAARDLQECLLIQLKQIPTSTPFYYTTEKILSQYMQVLATRDLNLLKRRLKQSEADMMGAIALIQTLNPRPGNSIESSHAQYVVPDVYVTRVKQGWRVELNAEASPKLRINAGYASLIKRADSSADNTCLKDHLQEARWFLKSLQSRNETLLKVATSIVEFQKGFFEQGEEAMKPLVLREIAENVEMHESTISRVTSQKYMHTSRGIFEFKYFFSSHVNTNEGGECSSTAIRAHIKTLIKAEPARKPLSDNKLSQLLAEQGIKVARRTVAKYREAMSIPPSNERKRLI
jgi:RNA polymerase sigma-54 factor